MQHIINPGLAQIYLNFESGYSNSVYGLLLNVIS